MVWSWGWTKPLVLSSRLCAMIQLPRDFRRDCSSQAVAEALDEPVRRKPFQKPRWLVNEAETQLRCPPKAGRAFSSMGGGGACITPVRGPPKSLPEEAGLCFPQKTVPRLTPVL